MKEYLQTLLHAQNAENVTDREAADIILTIEKSADPKAASSPTRIFVRPVNSAER